MMRPVYRPLTDCRMGLQILRSRNSRVWLTTRDKLSKLLNSVDFKRN